jgi:hypothetical protein
MSQRQTVIVLTERSVHAFACEGRGATVTKRHSVEFAIPRSLYAEHDVDALSDAIATCVGELALHSPSITIMIPLSWCYSHVLERPRQRNADQALCFAFEHYLPVPLEDLTCAFVPLSGDKTLALALPTAQAQRWIAAMEQRGLDVAHMVVDVASLMTQRQATGDGIILIDYSSIRFGSFGHKRSEPFAGFIDIAREAEPDSTLGDRLKQRGMEAFHHGNVLCLNDAVSPEMEGCFSDRAPADVVCGAAAIETIAQSACLSSHAGDLRVGALAAPGRWDAVLHLARHCALLLAACLAIAVVGLHGRHRAIDTQLQRVMAAQSLVYGEAFANQPAPPGAAMRLASERIRLEALTRKQTNSSEVHEAPLDVLREFVALLPGDVRITLQEARIDDKQIALRGLTAEHRDAERIAESMHKLTGVDVRPPRTRRLDTGGVEFSIAATSLSNKQQP